MLFPQRFGRYVIRPSSGVCRTREPGDPRGFNKGRSSKFRGGSRVRQTPEEGRLTYRPKRCGNNNKEEDNSPKTLNDKNNCFFFNRHPPPSRNFELRPLLNPRGSPGSRVRQTPEEGRMTYRPKRCGNNNKYEDNSLKTLNDKNQQASSQKFRQLKNN